MTDLKRVALANGIELDVWDSGPVAAPALIFLHGFPESHRTWRHQIAHLSPRLRCIAPDQRGYGGSSKPAPVASYVPERLVEDVFLLADSLGVGDFTVIGHDWGGMVAWGVAAAGAGRVTRAVIANAPHPALFQRLLHTDPAQRAASQYITLFRQPSIDAQVAKHGLAPVLLQAFGDGALRAMSAEERQALLTRWRDPAGAMAMLGWYRASPMVVPAPDAPITSPAPVTPPRLTIPVQVIWGMADTALLPANLDGLDDFVDDLTIVRLPHVGHFSPWAAPEAVNAALDAFLP